MAQTFIYAIHCPNEQHQLCIDFAPEDEEALRRLINPETDAEKRIGA